MEFVSAGNAIPAGHFETPGAGLLAACYADMEQAFHPGWHDGTQDYTAYWRARQFVGAALLGEIADIGPAQAWDTASDLLHKLTALSRQPAALRTPAEPASAEISSWLTQALDEHAVDQNNIASYLNAVTAISQCGWNGYDGYRDKHDRWRAAPYPFYDRYQTIEQLMETDEHKAAYDAILRQPAFISGFDYLVRPHEGVLNRDFLIDPEKYRQHEALLDKILRGIGLADVQACKKSWYLDSIDVGGSTWAVFMRSALRRLALVESQRPGGAELLHGTYGITGFAGYTSESLVKQIDQHGETDKPYGILVRPRQQPSEFHLDAIYDGVSYHGNDFASIIHDGLGDDYYLRIVEAHRADELAARLMLLDRIYGKEQKIAFVVTDTAEATHMLEMSLLGRFREDGDESGETEVQVRDQCFTDYPIAAFHDYRGRYYPHEHRGVVLSLRAQLQATRALGQPRQAGRMATPAGEADRL